MSLYIEKEEITDQHIERKVIYTAPNCGDKEYGRITSFNNSYIFVRFGINTTSQACSADRLTWDK